MSDQTPPQVPVGWSAHFSEEHKIWFYQNDTTHVSQWKLPTQPVETPTAPEPPKTIPAPPSVPEGWEARWSVEKYQWFFVNTETGHSQWDQPVIAKSPEAPPAAPVESAVRTQTEAATAQATQLESTAAQAQDNTAVQAAQPAQETPAQETRTPPAVPEGWEARWSDDKQAWFYVLLSTGHSQWELLTATEATQKPDPATQETRVAPQVPEGWEARWTDEKQTWFYVFTQTGHSQWEKPEAAAATPAVVATPAAAVETTEATTQQEEQPARVPPEVPAGWEARWTDEKQTWFYVFTQTGHSQWEMPVAIAPAATNANREGAQAATQEQAPAAPQAPAAQVPAAPQAPEGWRTSYSEEHKKWFFVNNQTGHSQWEYPTAQPAALAVPTNPNDKQKKRSSWSFPKLSGGSTPGAAGGAGGVVGGITTYLKSDDFKAKAQKGLPILTKLVPKGVHALTSHHGGENGNQDQNNQGNVDNQAQNNPGNMDNQAQTTDGTQNVDGSQQVQNDVQTVDTTQVAVDQTQPVYQQEQVYQAPVDPQPVVYQQEQVYQQPVVYQQEPVYQQPVVYQADPNQYQYQFQQVDYSQQYQYQDPNQGFGF